MEMEFDYYVDMLVVGVYGGVCVGELKVELWKLCLKFIFMLMIYYY